MASEAGNSARAPFTTTIYRELTLVDSDRARLSPAVLTGKLQYLAHLIWAFNWPGVARNPRGGHRLNGDALEIFTADL